MDPGKEFLGLGRRGSGFTSETWFWCCAGCTQQHPGSTCTAGCGWSWTSTAWMLLQAPRWAGAQLQRCPAALQPCCSAHPQHLLKKSGWAVWLCLLHLSNPWGIDRAPASLSLVVRMHYPRLFGQAAVSRTSSVLAGSWWTLTAIKLKMRLLNAETMEYGVISMLTQTGGIPRAFCTCTPSK